MILPSPNILFVEEKKNREGKYFLSRRRKTEKEKEENIWRRNFFVEERKTGVGKGRKYLEKRNIPFA